MVNGLRSEGHGEFSETEERGCPRAPREGHDVPSPPGKQPLCASAGESWAGTRAVPFPANVRRGLAAPNGCEGAAGSGGRPGGPRGAAAPPAVYSPPEPGSGCRLPAASAPRKPDAFAGFPDAPCKTGSEAIPRCRICKSLSFHLGKERGLRMGCVKYQNPISAALQS